MAKIDVLTKKVTEIVNLRDAGLIKLSDEELDQRIAKLEKELGASDLSDEEIDREIAEIDREIVMIKNKLA